MTKTFFSSMPVRVAIAAGADWFDLSSGGNDPRQEIPLEPGYQVPFARAVRQATGARLNAVGLIDEPELAEQVLADGDADAVMLGRPWLRNPHWALEAEAVLDSPSGEQIRSMTRYTAAGTPDVVERYLDDFATRADADELIVVCPVVDRPGWYRSFELLAGLMRGAAV